MEINKVGVWDYCMIRTVHACMLVKCTHFFEKEFTK